MLKLAAEELEDARDTRRSLWRVIDWSARASTPAPARGDHQAAWPS